MTDKIETAMDMATAVSEKIVELLSEHRYGLMEIGMDEADACFKSALPLVITLRGYRETVAEYFDDEALASFDELINEVTA